MHQQFAAALLLPLYYLADATVTLLRRMARREPFWAAHRSHFYQRATDNGFTVWRVVGEVFALNVGACGAGDRVDRGAIGRGRRSCCLSSARRRGRVRDVPVFAAAPRETFELLSASATAFASARHSSLMASAKLIALRDRRPRVRPIDASSDEDARRIARASSPASPGSPPSQDCVRSRSAPPRHPARRQDHGPADRQQIVEPARHRYAGDILAIGDEPDIGGGKEPLRDLRPATRSTSVTFGKPRLRLQLLQPLEADAPARQQEMNVRLVAQAIARPRTPRRDRG